MNNARNAAIRCKVAPGVFSGDRVVRFTLADGQEYETLVPRYYCWNEDRQLVNEHEPQMEADGFVACRVIETVNEGKDYKHFLVEVPDGEQVVVQSSSLIPRPTQVDSRVRPTLQH
jgi:hypothetical protein